LIPISSYFVLDRLSSTIEKHGYIKEAIEKQEVLAYLAELPVTENGPESPALKETGLSGPTLFGDWVG